MRKTNRKLLHCLCVILCVLLIPSFVQAAEISSSALQEEYVSVSEYVLQTGGLLPTAESDYIPAPKKMLSGGASELPATAKEAIYQGARNHAESINLSSYAIPCSDIGALYRDVLNENPDLICLTGAFSYNYSGDTVYSIFPKYNSYTQDDVNQLYSVCNKIISGMDSSFTDEQKLLYLHDYIVTHCEYDTSLQKSNIYNTLVEGSSVCQGYACSLVYLGKLANLDVRLVTSASLNHAWNMVLLDGSYYFVDCTWDDPVSFYEAYCAHQNFLRSRDQMIAQGHNGSADWTSTGNLNVYSFGVQSTKYDSHVWTEVLSAIPCLNNIYAYAKYSDKDNVYLKPYGGNESDYAIPKKDSWKVWDKAGYNYTYSYSSFTSFGDKFYFSTPSMIYQMSRSGVIEPFYTLTPDEAAIGCIYGIMYEADGLSYWLGTAPQNVSYEKKTITMKQPLFSLTGANLNLGNSLAMNFYFDRKYLDPDKKYYVQITKTYEDGTPDIVRSISQEEWNEFNADLYKVVCWDIAAKEMNDEIYVQVFEEGGTEVSEVWEDSIAAYVTRRLEKEDAYVKTAMVDMLNYGAASQIALGYDITHLANAWLNDTQKGYATQDAITCENHQSEEGLNYVGSNLNLGNNLSINMYFKNVTKNMHAIVEFVDHMGNKQSVRIEGSEFIDFGGGTYKICVKALAVADVKNLLTCKVLDENDVVVAYKSDSIESYIARKGDGSDIYATIMRFGASAYKNFHH